MLNGIPAAVFYRVAAWHGLGEVVTEKMTVESALTKAGLAGWELGLAPLRAVTRMYGEIPVPEHKAVVRKMDGKVLGVVGSRYTVIQNEEAFGVLNALTESGAITIDAAGALGEGERCWMSGALANAEAEVLPGDRIKGNLLCVTGHAGTAAWQTRLVATRVVCANTWRAAMSEETDHAMAVRHTASAEDRLAHAKATYEDVAKAWVRSVAEARLLARIEIGRAECVKLVCEHFGLDAATLKDEAPRTIDKIDRVVALWAGQGMGAETAGPTLWGLFNAVTESVDYNDRKGADVSAAFGAGDAAKAKAWRDLVSRARAKAGADAVALTN